MLIAVLNAVTALLINAGILSTVSVFDTSDDAAVDEILTVFS